MSISSCPNRHCSCCESQTVWAVHRLCIGGRLISYWRCIRMSEYKFGILAMWLRQKGHCQNPYFSACVYQVLVLFSCIYLDLIKYSCISLGHKIHLAGTSEYSLCKACLCLEERLLQVGFPTSHRIWDFSVWASTLQNFISVLNPFTDISPNNASVMVQWQRCLQQCRQYIVSAVRLWFLLSHGGEKTEQLFWKAVFQIAAISFFHCIIIWNLS